MSDLDTEALQAELERLRAENALLRRGRGRGRSAWPWPGDDASDAVRLAWAVNVAIAEAHMTALDVSEKLGHSSHYIAVWTHNLRRPGRELSDISRIRKVERLLGLVPGDLLALAKIIAPRATDGADQ